MNNKGKFLIIAVAIAVLTGLYNPAHAALETVGLGIMPDFIQVGALYKGSEVKITADIPEYSGAVIMIEGKGHEVELNKKGRVGIIWLNVAQITAENVPRIYFLASSDNIENLCSAEELDSLGIGYDALKDRIEFVSNSKLTGKEFSEFLKLKENSGLYNVNTKIDLEPPENGIQKMHTVLSIPSIIPPGKYSVLLYCFRDGTLIAKGSSDLVIEEVGLPHLMASLAYGHPALHGVLAVIVAILAGIIMGLIFSSRKHHGH